MKHEKIYNIVITIYFIILLFFTIFYARKSYESGRLCDKLRERIIDAEDTNRRLAETVERCKSISEELGQSVDRSIRTAREAIEVIEELRVQVYSLEVVCGGFDWGKYYSDTDSYLGVE